ncbi:MAG: phage portal protein [Planctomycetota bacterium]
MKFADLIPPILRRNAEPQAPNFHLPPWMGGGVGFGFDFGMIGWDHHMSSSVTEDEALTATAVYACVQVIASAIGTLPIHVRDIETNAIQRDHTVAGLLRRPNPYMTRSDMLEAWCLNLLTSGNGQLYTERNTDFEPVGLYPLRSLNVRPQRRRGRLRYRVVMNDKAMTVPDYNVVHVKNFSWDGMSGMSPLACGGHAVGLALALDQFAAKFFTNGAALGNIVELPPMKTEEQLRQFKRLWSEEYEGLANAHKTAAAPGLKVHKGGYSPKESQADEQRLTQLREVARIYQVPPHKIGDLEKTTVGNGEEQARQFAEGTLRRWVVKMEEALEATLLREDERDLVKIRFNLDAMIRGSLKDRIESMSKATGGAPIMTQNEARDQLDLQPVKGGDRLLSNLNQQAAEQRAALLDGVVTRMSTAENNALRRAIKKAGNAGQELRSWASEWFQDHELRLRQALDGSGVDGRQIAEYCEYRANQIESDASPASIQTMTAETRAVLARHIFEPAGPGGHFSEDPHHGHREPDAA